MAITRAECEALDREDALAPLRGRFSLPEGVIYLDGTSLGALPVATPGRVAEVVAREWGAGLIRSWNDAGWMAMPARVGDKIGRLVMTSQNLYFSARWLSDFYNGVCVPHGVRVYDCSMKGIANIPGAKLSTMLDMVTLRKATDQEKTNIIKANIWLSD